MQGVCYFGIVPEVIGCIPGTRSACRIGQVVQNWKQNGNQMRTRWGRWIRFLGKGTVTTVTSTCDRKRESVNNLIFKYIMIQIGWLVCFVKTLSTYYTYTYKRTPKIMKSRLWTLNLTIAGYFWTIQLARLQTWTRLVFFSSLWIHIFGVFECSESRHMVTMSTWTWCMRLEVLATPLAPFGFLEISRSVHYAICDSDTYKNVGMVQYFNTQFLPCLNPRPLRNLLNVWHHYYPTSQHCCRNRVRWRRRQSNPHSWREVSPKSIQWCTNCT